MKRLFAALKELLQLGAQPASKMSQKWREDELWQHEQIEDRAMRIKL